MGVKMATKKSNDPKDIETSCGVFATICGRRCSLVATRAATERTAVSSAVRTPFRFRTRATTAAMGNILRTVSNTINVPFRNDLASTFRRPMSKKPRTNRKKMTSSVLPRSMANRTDLDVTAKKMMAVLAHACVLSRSRNALMVITANAVPSKIEEREVAPRNLRSSHIGG